MYIIIIGWLYVTVLMALTESTILAGMLSFIFYGLAPSALLLWLFTSRQRRQRSNAVTGDQTAHRPDRSDTQADQ